MKENEVPKNMYIPEKIYLPYKDGKVIGLVKETGVPYKSGVDGNIEYIRKDAFIKKATNFLNYKLDDVVNVSVHGTLIPELTTRQVFIEHFKKYMED